MDQPTITITGPQGSGKTTLLAIIANALKEAGVKATCYDDGERIVPAFRTAAPPECPLRRTGVTIVTEN